MAAETDYPARAKKKKRTWKIIEKPPENVLSFLADT